MRCVLLPIGLVFLALVPFSSSGAHDTETSSKVPSFFLRLVSSVMR